MKIRFRIDLQNLLIDHHFGTYILFFMNADFYENFYSIPL